MQKCTIFINIIPYFLASVNRGRNNSQNIAKETLIKTKSPRSNERTHAADIVTLRFNQHVPKI